jgi:hypothetical protein
MRPEDVNAVTAWLAMQAMPDDAGADRAFEHPPALKCGSILYAEQIP